MKSPRVVKFLGVLTAVVMVAVASGALLLPRFIDSRLIRDKIASEFLKKTKGSVTFAKIALFWFPRPTVLIEEAQVSFGDRAQGSIKTTKIYPSIPYLLTGRLVVRRALLQAPRIRLRLPASVEESFNLEELERQIRSALVRFTRELPAPRIDVSDGSAEIRIGAKMPLILEDVALQAIASPAELGIDFSARSSLWERLNVEAKISSENLVSQLNIDVQRLKVRDSLDLLSPQISELAPQGEASVNVKVDAVGLRKITAAIDGSAGPIVLTRNGSTATLEVKRLKGGISYEGGAFQADVEQLELDSPRLKGSGQLNIRSGSLSASVKLRDIDIAEVSDRALRVVADPAKLKRTLRYIPAGQIPEINIQSAGRSFAEMALSKNIVVSGLLRGGRVFIPGPDFELQNVSGSVRISRGVLEADKVSANLGTMRAWNGVLRLGLDRQTAPFHLDLLAQASAPEVQSVLLKLTRDEAVRSELLKVRNVEGQLSGRLILGEATDAISAVVSISSANISARYEPVPFPIAIRGGRLNYDQKLIRLENMQGSVGRSTFAGLGVALHRDRSHQIKIDSGRLSLDLQQMETVLRTLKDLPAYVTKLQSAHGQVELQNLTLAGAYDDPAGWAFASKGTVNQVEIRHADLPDRITLSRGKFTANQGRLVFSDAATAMLDGSLIAAGTFEYKKAGPTQFTMSGTGTMGEQMTQWMSGHLELPEEFKLRSPLKVAAETMAWHAGGEISFRGQVGVAGGPMISLDASKHQQALAVHNLAIDDGNRHARMMLQLDKDNLDLSFDGELTQQTIDRVFASFPIKGSSLRGDIQINAALADPIRFSARGQLSGSNVLIPLGIDRPLIEKFAIMAGGKSVVIRSAELRWGKSHLTASGEVAGATEALRVDLDVTADQLDWQQFQRSFGGEGKQRKQKIGGAMSLPDVEGTIRLKTNRFTFEHFNASQVETTAAISPSGIRAEIDRGVVCGINTTGRLDVTGEDIDVDLRLVATDAQLEPTTVCLTDRQNDIKGTYSLTARLAGRGNRGQLLRSLKGNFELGARNGEFVRSPGIDATFDYLNATGDFKVAFPDLDRETFPYRFVGLKGRIEGTMLVADEVNVASSLLNLSGQGKVDLEQKRIDGKGLVSVLKPVDEVIARIPVISSILGGSLVSIPVRVTGALERPDVTYLSPADVGAELLNFSLRILGMPLGAMRLFTPSGEPRDKEITK
jgi:hypothetical protein